MSRQWTAWNPLESIREKLMQKCYTWDYNSSDSDLTEIQYDGKVNTLLMWDATDQSTIGFSELALYDGPMANFFAAYFE